MTPRLSESTLPLHQISLDSVHEKSVRHGHISTLHIWPARRPLAASRAMLLTTLLPDPSDPESRRRLGEQMAGRLVPKRLKGSGEDRRPQGDLGRNPALGSPTWFSARPILRPSQPGLQRTPSRASSIPSPAVARFRLEAMRLGCETFASDLNPVAWFILRCTLHYPRIVGREERPLPAIRHPRPRLCDRACQGTRREDQGSHPQRSWLGSATTMAGPSSWHRISWLAMVPGPKPTSHGTCVRGGCTSWAMCGSRLAHRYPTYAYFEPLKTQGRGRSAMLPSETLQAAPTSIAGTGRKRSRRRLMR